MGAREKTVTVFEVLYDGREGGPAGPAGDGTFTERFGPKDKARALARRWGLA